MDFSSSQMVWSKNVPTVWVNTQELNHGHKLLKGLSLFRPKQTWKKLTEKDCREWKLTTVDPQERSTWRSGVRSAMRAASQLPGKGPTDVDDAPAPAR